MKTPWIIIAACLLCAAGLRAQSEDVIPPASTNHFSDYANVISPAMAAQLNQTLAQFERGTSDQILVAIFPKLQTTGPMEDWTLKVFNAWKPGQAGTNNGAILFVFVQDHKMRIETGDGLKASLSDSRCKQILDNDIAPRFRQGDYNGGVTAGVKAMLAAARGGTRFRGNGSTVRERSAPRPLPQSANLLNAVPPPAQFVAPPPAQAFPNSYPEPAHINYSFGGPGIFGAVGGLGFLCPMLFLAIPIVIVGSIISRFTGAPGGVYRRGRWYDDNGWGGWGGGGWGNGGHFGGGGSWGSHSSGSGNWGSDSGSSSSSGSSGGDSGSFSGGGGCSDGGGASGSW